MKKLLCRTVLISNELEDYCGEKFMLEYYLLQSDIFVPESKIIVTGYGAGVDKIFCSKKEECIESSQTDLFTYSASEARNVLDTLADNKITTITFHELTNDIIQLQRDMNCEGFAREVL